MSITNSATTSLSVTEQSGRLYRTLWRWHFYAGLFCIPFIIILSLTGVTYLFKAQIEAAFDAPYNSLVLTGPTQPVSVQIEAALNAIPGASLKTFGLPQEANNASQIVIAKNGTDTLVYLHPVSLEVLKIMPTQDRLMSIIRRLHSELLMGDNGSLIVELAASWALVMVVTGLYLWWPRQYVGMAGILWPRLNKGRRILWRDIHSVTGIWISFFAVFLLLSGLPWTSVWGDVFDKVRRATGTASVSQDWSKGPTSQHVEMGGGNANEHAIHAANPVYAATIDDIVASTRAAQLQPPVVIIPPNAKKRVWRAVSQTQNRPLGTTLEFDANDGTLIRRSGFTDKHPIDQAVGIGISAHEGALFGPLNQVIGVATALGLVLLSVSAFVMWRKREPTGGLGAPPPIHDTKIGVGLGALIIVFGIFLPMLGLCLIAVALGERLILSRFASARAWLGLSPMAPTVEKKS